MAINWSAQYPGQIGTDPGWPYGKPRNIVVPGDGTGTPLEAAWVSDLAGWQAALLTEAGITPSGVPDNTAASDYVEAIKIIATGAFAGFTGAPHTWTATQTFTSVVAQALGVVGPSAEVLYTDAAGAAAPRETWRSINLAGGVGDTTGRYDINTGTLKFSSVTVVAARSYALRVPQGGSIIGYLASVRNTSAINVPVEVRISKTVHDALAATATFTVIDTTTITVTAGGAALIADAAIPTPEPIDNGATTYNLDLIVQGDIEVFAASIGFRDPGPRN